MNKDQKYGDIVKPVVNESPISHSDENWEALPKRLRGRGDFHLERGRIKDAELMFDAAAEIENLRWILDNKV